MQRAFQVFRGGGAGAKCCGHWRGLGGPWTVWPSLTGPSDQSSVNTGDQTGDLIAVRLKPSPLFHSAALFYEIRKSLFISLQMNKQSFYFNFMNNINVFLNRIHGARCLRLDEAMQNKLSLISTNNLFSPFTPGWNTSLSMGAAARQTQTWQLL